MKLFGNRRRQITLTITSGAAEYNVRTQAGTPTDAVDVVVIVNSGALVNPNSTAGWALRFGTGWTAGSTFRLNNSGTITGAGGNGSNGSASPSDGGAGGPAINLDGNSVSIDNTSGYIQGGGGGGSGGLQLGGFSSAGGGGGGAGWDGFSGGLGGSGTGAGGTSGATGSISGGGIGGDGGDQGGAGGAPGSDGVAAGAAGGAAGKAVDLAGGSVTWLGGYNSTQVKGAVS